MNMPGTPQPMLTSFDDPKDRVWAYFRSEAEVRDERSLLGYAHHILRAFENDVLGITGALCIDGVPTIYFRRFDQPLTWQKANELHRVFWNQGIATILVLADPTRVRIFSGQARPSSTSHLEEASPALVTQELEDIADLLDFETLLFEVTTGQFYHEHSGHFNEKQGVDHFLLASLAAARDELISPQFGEQEAHALLGRLIFLCYLTDRGIINWTDYVNEVGTGVSNVRDLLEHTEAADGAVKLSRLFDKLHRTFNGSMFDNEEVHLTRKQYDVLRRFFAVADVRTGQGTLGFWAFDFRVIPVETISSIYEDFLSKEDAEGKHKAGAFYTPRHLAEMVVDAAIEGHSDWHKWRYLDCSAGSGIFLVTIFNRLASRWVFEHLKAKYQTRVEALLKILHVQLCGVDKNPTACRIACFSLYLAFLDQFAPRDLREFADLANRNQRKVLPKLLHDRAKPAHRWSEEHAPTIIQQDFHQFSDGQFDCVIGNPPWFDRGTQQEAWNFMKEAPRHLRTGAAACLLLPAKVLLNKTDEMQAEWFQDVTVERVINLSDFRHILFEHAKCPSLIIRFANVTPDVLSHSFRYDTPKVTGCDTRDGVITIYPRDRKRLNLADLLAATIKKEAPKFWKKRFTCTPRDLRLLDLLDGFAKIEELTTTAYRSEKTRKKWLKGQGIQPDTHAKCKNPQKPWWDKDRLFLSARSDTIKLHVFPEDCSQVGNRFPRLYRSRHPDLFEPPLVIASQGFGKVAFCDFPMLFQHSLQSLTVASADPKKRDADRDLLMFLTVYLRSKLARYYLFHTSANWGAERDKVHLFELLHLPFPLPGSDHANSDSTAIVSRVAERMKALRTKLERELEGIHAEHELRKGQVLQSSSLEEDVSAFTIKRLRIVDALQAEMEAEVYRYFDLTNEEIALVEDTLSIVEESSTPTTRDKILKEEVRSIKQVRDDELRQYAEMLTSTLNAWAAKGKTRIDAHAVRLKDRRFVLLTLHQSKTSKAFRIGNISEREERAFARIYSAAVVECGRFAQPRTVTFFDNQNIYLLKPAAIMHWTRTAALNDADEIFARVIRQRRDQIP